MGDYLPDGSYSGWTNAKGEKSNMQGDSLEQKNNNPTAEEFFKKSKNIDYRRFDEITQHFLELDLIEFAKMHVTEALKQASENVEFNPIPYTNDYEVDKQSILNAYPLDQIK